MERAGIILFFFFLFITFDAGSSTWNRADQCRCEAPSLWWRGNSSAHLGAVDRTTQTVQECKRNAGYGIVIVCARSAGVPAEYVVHVHMARVRCARAEHYKNVWPARQQPQHPPGTHSSRSATTVMAVRLIPAPGPRSTISCPSLNLGQAQHNRAFT